MPKTHKKSLFLFRRDLRLEDNLGLLFLLERSEHVVPAFIFDDRQTSADANDYFSAPAFQILLQSLAELDEALHNRGSKLFVFSGRPSDIVQQLITNEDIDAVGVNKDYTPFSRTRDKELADVCEATGVPFSRHDDVALSPLEDIRTQQDRLYTVFTPFMRNAKTFPVSEPQKNNFSNYVSGKLTTPTTSIESVSVDLGDRELLLHGGRTEALSLLREQEQLTNYEEQRNYPAQRGTSRLSAHHKFGTISVRETYHAALKAHGADSQFISELYWRDFYYYIAYHFPGVFGASFLPWAKHLAWKNDTAQFTAWCEGRTGVPIVDAGMRELNHTGWMHNRSRMIVASYLTKNLLIDWRWGERYFAQNLLDYDPAQNNGGWQWSASTGADPRPLRIFNPYTQAQKYDPEAEYMHHWVPELRNVEATRLTDGKTQDFSELTTDYPAPIVDQKATYHRAREVYKEAKEKWRRQGER